MTQLPQDSTGALSSLPRNSEHGDVPRDAVLHYGPRGGGKTPCGRLTAEVHLWATAGLVDAPSGFLTARRRCQACRDAMNGRRG